jgi:hypothetical protein
LIRKFLDVYVHNRFYSVLFPFKNIVVLAFLPSVSSSYKMARHSRNSLQDNEVVQELHADQLSDAPSDCESDKSSDDDDDDDDDDGVGDNDDFGPSMAQKGRKRARLEVSDSDVDIYDDCDVDDGLTENDDYGNVEQFVGNTGCTFTPDDTTSISEVVSRYLGNDFLETFVEQSNLCHAQNADKTKTPHRL